MRFAVALLMAAAAWGQTITNWQVDGQTHSTARVGFSKTGDTTTAFFVIVSTTLPTNCTTDTSHRRYDGTFPQTGAQDVVIPITGLAPSTTFKWGVCRISDSTLLGTSDDATPDADIVTTAAPSIHPALPTPILPTASHTALPPSFAGGDYLETSCANFQSRINTEMAAASRTDDTRIRLANSAGACGNITANTARGSGSTGWILITTEDHAALPPWGAQVAEFDSNKMAEIAGTIDVTSTKVIVRGFHQTGPATGSTVNLTTSSGTDVIFQHMVIDRALGSSNTTRSAFDLVGATRVSMLDNYIRVTMGTSQARCLQLEGNGAANAWFRNNYLNCPGNSIYSENHQSSDAVFASNIIVEKNIFDWDEKYRPGSATSDGVSYGAWQAIEFKGMQGARVQGNWFRHYWPRQDEFLPLLAIYPRVATCGFGTGVRAVRDVEFSYNWAMAGGGVMMEGFINDPCAADNAMPLPANNFWVRHNLFSRLRPLFKPSDSSNNNRLEIFRVQGIEDVTIENNSIVGLDGTDTRQTSLRFDCGPVEGLVYRNNIIRWANAGGGGGMGYGGSCTWPLGGSAPSNSGPAKDVMDLFLFRLGSGASYTFTHNAISADSGLSTATISAANYFPSGQYFIGDGQPKTLAGFKDASNLNSEDIRNFCLDPSSANIARGTDGRPLGANCELLQEMIGGVQDVVIKGVTGTTADIAWRAPGGLTGPGTACAADVSTSSTFTVGTTSRVTATVNSAFPWNQSAQFTSLTVKTTYYFRTHCAGLPYTSGTFTTRPA